MKTPSTENSGSDWDDFEVLGSSAPPSPAEMLQRYLQFKEACSMLPKKELVDRGWIRNKADSASLVSFFSHFYRGESRALYRKSTLEPSALDSLWLSKAKETAERAFVEHGLEPFRGIDKAYLRALAEESVDPKAIANVAMTLREKGVLLVYVPALTGLKVDGLVFKLPTANPAIVMSIRFPRLDYFWFTLMHELAHIVLHDDLLDEPIVDGFDEEGTTAVEVQANRLAKDSFVPRHYWRDAAPKYEKSAAAVRAFARKMRVHPAIVAGLLRKEEGNYQAYSAIVNEINTRDILFPEV